MNTDDTFDEREFWTKPFATPMVADAFAFVTGVIRSSHPGAVIYAPSGTGKSCLIKLMESEADSFSGPRGNLVRSIVISFSVNERYVMSEGGVWGWLLHGMNHFKAGARMSVLDKRFLVYEYLKGLAARSRSGRLIAFFDEAQKLGMEELGLLADLVNELARNGYSLVVFLVGSYHLNHWIDDLRTRRYSHVRRRFFTKEYRLKGLCDVDDFRRCLRRYDVYVHPPTGVTSVEYYQPKWYKDGGRLESYASAFRAAFKEGVPASRDFHVPMACFCLTLQYLLDQSHFRIDAGRLKNSVLESGFQANYESDADQ